MADTSSPASFIFMGRLNPTTVRDFEAIGYTISPNCSHFFQCTHFKTLRVEYLAEHLGWDFDLYDKCEELLRRLTCSVCGWHWPVIQSATQQNRTGVGGSHTPTVEISYEEPPRRQLAWRATWS